MFVAKESSRLLPALASFLAVVSAGSFTRAARASGTDKAVLSRRVARLEAALHLRLFNRTTRSVRVTDDGQALFDRVVGPLSQVLTALETTAAPEMAQGEVRVSTFNELASVWGVVAATLQAEHPQLVLSLGTDDAGRRLVDGGFDLGVTAGHLSDSSMVAVKLGTFRHVLVASPEWVRAHPEVREPADLAPHWIRYRGIPFENRWTFEQADRSVTVLMGAALACTTSALIRTALLEGVGVTAGPPFYLQRDVEDGRLVRVLPEWRTAHVMPLWAVRPHRDFVPTRVQAVIDTTRQVLRSAAPEWATLSD